MADPSPNHLQTNEMSPFYALALVDDYTNAKRFCRELEFIQSVTNFP